jgi:hypothetical protein
MTCTLTCVTLKPDTMAGYNPQKISRSKDAARYIVISLCICSAFYLQSPIGNHVVRNQCLSFLSERNSNISGIQRPLPLISQDIHLRALLQVFFLVLSAALLSSEVRSCDLSTRDRISTGGPGEIWLLFVSIDVRSTWF